MRAAVVVLCLALASCGHMREPRIVTRDVVIEKPVPCKVKAPAAPSYPDTDAAIAAAPDVFERGKLFIAGRLMRIAHEAQLRAALRACQ
jgi:hypothetical protein